MKKFPIALLAMAVGIALAPSARASTISFDVQGTGAGSGFQFTGLIDSGVSPFTIVADPSGMFSLSGVSGGTTATGYTLEAAGDSIHSLTGGGPSGTSDNELYIPPINPNSPFDSDGVIIKLLSGVDAGDYVWMFYDPANATNVNIYMYTSGGFITGEDIGMITTTLVGVTPEPSSLLMLGTGLLLLAGLLFWKKGIPEKRKQLQLAA
jgi:PEP-CTERM motif